MNDYFEDFHYKNLCGCPKPKQWEIDNLKNNYSLPQEQFKRPIINLKKYIMPMIEKFLSKVKKYRIKQLRLGKGYIPKGSTDLMKAYKNKRKCSWIGIIYKITETFIIGGLEYEGRILYGYTTDTLDSRWEWYKKNANDENITNQRIHDAILDIQNNGKNPDDVFKREVIEVHFNDMQMRRRERFWISKDNAQDPQVGFNTNKGGEGGPTLFIPINLLIEYLAHGHGPTRIAEELLKDKIEVSRNTVNRRICDYWHSFNNGRKKFLKPILVKIIEDGYRSQDIISAFGKHGRNIVENLIPEYFNGMTFLELKEKLLKKKISKLIPFVCTEEEIFLKLSNFGRVVIINLINNHWGGFHKAQLKKRRPIVIKLLREDVSGPDIFHSLGYKYSNAYNRHNKLMQNLFGVDTESARRYFKTEFLGHPKDYVHMSIILPPEIDFNKARRLIEENIGRYYSGAAFIRDLGGFGYEKITITKNSNKIIENKFFGLNFQQLKNFIIYDILPPEFENNRYEIDGYFL